jgi:hypothetical protein
MPDVDELYDAVAGRTLATELRCSFDAFLEDYSLAGPAPAQLASIVRGADTDDQTMPRHGLLICDALYAGSGAEGTQEPGAPLYPA